MIMKTIERKNGQKKVQNKNDSKKSKENGQKSPREKERKRQNQKIAITSTKETYGEERKIENIKGVFLPQKTTKYHTLAPHNQIV